MEDSPFHTLPYGTQSVAELNTLPYGFLMTKRSRLTREDWLAAGFAALVQGGPGAIKAEVIARDLKTTKGSFYWHFRDVPEYCNAMMAHWEARGFAEITALVEAEDTPAQRLRRLGELAAKGAEKPYGGGALEPAIRAWALADPEVARAVARIDGLRLEYLGGLLSAHGLTNPDFARVIYAALIGLEDLAVHDDGPVAPPLATLIDLILALE